MNSYKKISIAILLSATMLSAGNIEKEPTSPVVPIIKVQNWSYYLGVGFSYQYLNNKVSEEKFNSYGGTLIAGMNFNDYFGIQGRYTQNIANLSYEKGDTLNPNNNDFDATLSSISALVKVNSGFQTLNPYLLIGYGTTELDSIPLTLGKAKRSENSFQYGVGVEYSITQYSTFFIDYLHLYDDVGFDGRATNSDVYSGETTIGFTYRF